MKRRAVAAEFIGSALLVATVVGSGVMAERLANGNAAIALLANTLATGAVLVALISAFASISGAHFNPVVTFAEAALKRLAWRVVPFYVVAQVLGAIGGTLIAHAMFDLPAVTWSQHARTGMPIWFSEVVAIFGLLTVVFHAARANPLAVPNVAAAWIMAAYWFTASTSFANPAVAIARSMSDTFAGIRPGDVPAFILAEVIGAGIAVLVFRSMSEPQPDSP